MTKVKLSIVLVLTVFLSFFSNAKGKIVGYAPEFYGETATLYAYTDFFTMTKVVIGEGVVGKDSVFTIDNKVGTTMKTLLVIGKTQTELYVMPNASYTLEYFKPVNEVISFTNQNVTPIFYNLDSTDVNARILKYNNAFDKYIYYNRKNIARHGFKTYLDSFKILAYSAYSDMQNEPFFINYVRFNIAIMERANRKREENNAKVAEFFNYIEPYPVFPHNEQYIEFIKGFYDDNFDSYNTSIKAGVILAIDNQSPTRLMEALKKDKFLQKEELREMIMINMLGSSYYKRSYSRQNISVILDSVSTFGLYKSNRVMAKNMINFLTRVEKGYPAPEINMELDSGKVLSWKQFEGRFVYVNFFATWNQPSVNEMKLIESLKEKYGEYISFVSFCVDESEEKFKAYKTAHASQNWDIYYIGKKSDLMEKFNVVTIPAYYLIGQEGEMALSFANGPAPDGVGLTIEVTFDYIKTEMEKFK